MRHFCLSTNNQSFVTPIQNYIFEFVIHFKVFYMWEKGHTVWEDKICIVCHILMLILK